MGKNKLKKFRDMETIDCVFQYPFHILQEQSFPLKGRWRRDFFKNDNPVVLELGCGKGEYAVGLAQRFPDKNFIGVDIKGARMWTGATAAKEKGLKNVAFLRTSIELIENFFEPNEVDEIWITFPDPQMKKVNKRLTSTRFLNLYKKITADGALIHLKTDSPFLYTYTHQLTSDNSLSTVIDTADLYGAEFNTDTLTPEEREILSIRTFYEQQWLERGLTIKYIKFRLNHAATLTEPDIDIEFDTYRSFSRGILQHNISPESV